MARLNLRLSANPSASRKEAEVASLRYKRRLATALSQLREEPISFFRTLLPDLTVFRVYAVDTTHGVARTVVPGTSFAKLTDGELESTNPRDPGFRDRQLHLLARFGHAHAFAAKRHTEIAHVSWLLTAEASAKEEIAVIPLESDEAEITGCETQSHHRRRGIYRFVIGELAAHAATLGIRRIFMKATIRNYASQRGISGAGLKHAGFAVVASVPGRNIKPIVLTWLS